MQSRRCILSKFYIKPQHRRLSDCSWQCCILSKFYIKPQRVASKSNSQAVVSYRNSTSNHNKIFCKKVVKKLYLIEILHQTTTPNTSKVSPIRCILSKFYIKPQPWRSRRGTTPGCILSKFYIKPQPPIRPVFYDEVVSYRNSTSNHNFVSEIGVHDPVVSYRNSTSNHNRRASY